MSDLVPVDYSIAQAAQYHAAMFPDSSRTPANNALWSDYYTILMAMEAIDSALSRLDAAGYEEFTGAMWSGSKDIDHALDDLAEQLRHDSGEAEENEHDH